MSRWKFGKPKEASADSLSVNQPTLPGTTTSLRSAWSLAKPYYTTSDRKWKARGLLATVVGLTLGQVYLDVKLSHWGNSFYNTISELAQTKDAEEKKKKEQETYDLLRQFSILAGIFIVAAVSKQKLTAKLQLDWREWMTGEYSKSWTSNDSFYKIKMQNGPTDNPDQRISDDVAMFTGRTLGLSLGLMRASLSLPSFSYILWNLSGSATVAGVTVPGYLMFAALGYAAAGTYLGHKLGKPLVKMNQDQQKYEADYRFALINVRNNAEPIALYGGAKVEDEILKERFSRVVTNTNKIIEKNKQMTAFNVAYNQAAVIFPYMITLPRLVAGQVKLGDFFQCASAFNNVQSDLSWFFNSYTELADWKAVTNRLTSFNAALESSKNPQPVPGGTS